MYFARQENAKMGESQFGFKAWPVIFWTKQVGFMPEHNQKLQEHQGWVQKRRNFVTGDLLVHAARAVVVFATCCLPVGEILVYCYWAALLIWRICHTLDLILPRLESLYSPCWWLRGKFPLSSGLPAPGAVCANSPVSRSSPGCRLHWGKFPLSSHVGSILRVDGCWSGLLLLLADQCPLTVRRVNPWEARVLHHYSPVCVWTCLSDEYVIILCFCAGLTSVIVDYLSDTLAWIDTPN